MAGDVAPLIGVLALQGDVREHEAALDRLGAARRAVRLAKDLDGLDGLVIPGGESSVIDKLARRFGLAGPLRAAIADGLPVYGTCAGMILLADRIENPIDGQESFGGLDVSVRRNAFGGQRESFEVDLVVPALGGAPVHAAFIRAPLATRVGDGVKVLGALEDGRVVAVRQGPLLATAFHPEVSGELRFHELFLGMVAKARRLGPPAASA